MHQMSPANGSDSARTGLTSFTFLFLVVLLLLLLLALQPLATLPAATPFIIPLFSASSIPPLRNPNPSLIPAADSTCCFSSVSKPLNSPPVCCCCCCCCEGGFCSNGKAEVLSGLLGLAGELELRKSKPDDSRCPGAASVVAAAASPGPLAASSRKPKLVPPPALVMSCCTGPSSAATPPPPPPRNPKLSFWAPFAAPPFAVAAGADPESSRKPNEDAPLPASSPSAFAGSASGGAAAPLRESSPPPPRKLKPSLLSAWACSCSCVCA
mmetsp:Transcript_17291/g.31024  ORF Transcript_17291/g.31024 Transcript_17291/m.31024 type:complete len:268 (+) Transcript_17291:182-985(+)